MSVRVLPGDCVQVMKELDAASFDACVTDPPYHLTTGKKGGSGPASVNLASPYGRSRIGTGFMGKAWDGGDVAMRPETWAEVLRLLKPGAHLLAFGGTRTFHRMAVAIEDAGFEIRDSISYLHDGGIPGPLLWCFGSGFPKSHDVSKKLGHIRCLCGVRQSPAGDAAVPSADVLWSSVRGGSQESAAGKQDVHGLPTGMDAGEPHTGSAESDLFSGLQRHGGVEQKAGNRARAEVPVRDVRNNGGAPSLSAQPPEGDLLQLVLPEQDICGAMPGDVSERLGSDHARSARAGDGASQGCDEPLVEGRRDSAQEARELCERPVCPLPAGTRDHGQTRRVCDGASVGDGPLDWPPAGQEGMRASQGRCPTEQPKGQSGTLAGQPQPQNGGAWPLCDRCGKPRIPEGLGTALKPAWEPIIVARKPLDGTVAANVLAHGTGALNIDGCRIGTTKDVPASGRTKPRDDGWGMKGSEETAGFDPNTGRWPANVIHDGGEEVLQAFAAYEAPGQQRSVGPEHGTRPSKNTFGDYGPRPPSPPRGDAGTAARFFYSAKADATDRLGSKHPTVKPVDLMRYLCRLVTRPGGLILDPFAGSGTTGMAAMAEGFRAVLIEREAEYVEDIRRRLAHVMGVDTPLFAASDQ